MDISSNNPKDLIFALDIGTRSIIGTVGVIENKSFKVLCEKYAEHKERAMIDGQIHDVNLVAETVDYVKKSIEEELNIKLQDVAIAAAGRLLRTTEAKAEMTIDRDKEIDKELIRSLELTAVKQAEDIIKEQSDGKLYCVGYSVKNYYLNDYIISNLLSQKGEKISAEVIATFLPRSVVDSLYSVINKVHLNVKSLTLEPIAAMEAVVPKKLRLLNIALVDVGAGTSDVAISSNDSVKAYGMVPMAGDEVTEAIVQKLLVDFNTAEIIKRKASKGETAKYIDVLGLEGEVSPEEVIKIIDPVVSKITDEIGKKIIDINGGKSPSVVFLVGGGAHTPNFKEKLAEKLNLPLQRIAVKGRDAVTECSNYDEKLGSAGVTVLGIALVAIKKRGSDFIDVILNGEVVSLFNSNKHKVMDAMLQLGINHKSLIGKNGNNIRFTLNGIKRVAFGSLAKEAEILVNGEKGSIDTEIKEGDNIQIIYAKDGKDAAPKVMDYIKDINSISFYFNDEIVNLNPVVFINDKRAEMGDYIKEGDNVKIIMTSTLEDYIKYYNKEEKKSYFLNGKEINKDYVIKEGDRIYSFYKEDDSFKEDDSLNEDNSFKAGDAVKAKEPSKVNELKVYVNEKEVILTGKEKYIFVDIFDHIDFDLTRPRGSLILLLNDNKAKYYDELKDGDSIKVFWQKN